MAFTKDLRRITHPYYLVNIFLSLSYLLAKKLPYVCNYLFFSSDSKCELDSGLAISTQLLLHIHKLIETFVRLAICFLPAKETAKPLQALRWLITVRESEILFFLIIVIMIRTRKTGSVTMISYLSSSFIYTKVANMILWFYSDIKMGLVYTVIFVLTGMFFPEPTYSGPQNITYFRGLQGLEDELERDKQVNWLVAFYTMWNPSCNNFAPIFSQLSASYHTNNLRFGKVDIGRYPEAGKKYHVSDSPVSRQLPTLILFQNGKETIRRPTVDSSKKLQKFFFSEDNIRVTFDLNNLYEQSKAKSSTGKKAALTNSKKNQ